MPVTTQAEVARAAGVSQNTVSLALRGDPRLPAGTRARVKAVAARLGYRSNPLVTALMAQVRRRKPVYRSTIACVLAGPERRQLGGHPSLRRVLAGAHARAEARGFRLEEFWLRDAPVAAGRLAGMLAARGIHGVVLHPDEDSDEPPNLPWDRLASAVLAFLDRRFNRFHCASLPPFRHVEIAVRQARSAGCSRIGLALPARYDRALEGLYTAGFNVLCKPGIPAFIPLEWSRSGFLAWYERWRPDVILVRSPEIRDWLKAEGLRIPRDVSLIHLGWNRQLADWAGVDPCADAIGAAAVDLVVEQLLANEQGLPAEPKMVLLNGRWVNGATLRNRTP